MDTDPEPDQPVHQATDPQWKCHDHPDYDSVLAVESAAALEWLRHANAEERLKFICDPREMHRRLYSKLAPSAYPEFAGTYRGTKGSFLERRRLGVELHFSEGHQVLVEPDNVSRWMEQVCKTASAAFAKSESITAQEFLLMAVQVFYVLGLTHPFADGNGHIQRLAFAACIFQRSDLRLRDTWTIHPRPYDIEIVKAFEAPGGPKDRLKSLFNVLREYVL